MEVERYHPLKLLGKGTMSIVYLVRDLTTQDLVVLKIMTAVPEDDKRNEKARDRFLREIKIARSLRHPHILPVLDSGYTVHENRSVPYLVSPYIKDGSLADLIKSTPTWQLWTLPQTADAIMQAAESLYYLHTRNPHIVHEDVKPGNFLYAPIQDPKRAAYLYLCDFGISRWQKNASTIASEVLGTFAYMAPEQVEGQVDCASDQYALAVMACYMLTGKLPLQAATNDEYIQAHLHATPIPPGQLYPEHITSAEIDAVVLRALEKDPARRFPTILEFGHALQEAITKQARIQAGARTERLDLASAKTVAMNDALAPAVHVRDIAFAQDDTPIVIDPPDLSEKRILDEPLPPKPVRPTVMVKSGSLLAPLNLIHPVYYELSARPKMLRWSHNGNMLACVLYGQAPTILSVGSGLQSVHIAQAAQTDCVSWSPDGRVLAISTLGEIHFWDVATQTELPLVLQFPTKSIDAMDWSVRERLALWVDNQILLYTLPYSTLSLRQIPSSQMLATGAMRCGNIGTLRWSPDGVYLAAGANNGAAVCWTVDRQLSMWQITPPGQKVYSLAWSPDGTMLVLAFRDNRAAGWHTHTQEQIFQWQKLPAMPRTLSISVENRIVIASGQQRLFCGFPDEIFPSNVIPGQLVAQWSPTQPELATLHEQKDTTLVIWRVGTY